MEPSDEQLPSNNPVSWFITGNTLFVAGESLNKFTSDDSHGRLEQNGKLIKNELAENTVTSSLAE